MDNAFNKIRVINEFKSHIKNKIPHGNDGFQFNGLVEYEAYGKIVSEVLEVIIIVGGYDPSVKLDIYEKGVLITNDEYHMDFNPRFENTDFQFNSVNSRLIIIGKNSKKMGNYKLEISEL